MPETLDERLKHPCFPQPAVQTVQVWRYMGLAGLISLLRSSQLHLSRLDLLRDPHEGALPRANVTARDALFEDKGAAKILPQLRETGRRIRTACYVNCWAMSSFESEALWRLFAGEREGVAIQSTYQQLVEVARCDQDLYVGCVRYLDYETEWFPAGNLYYPVMHKRRAFAHEKEVRFVKMAMSHVLNREPAGPAGLKAAVDLNSLINGVFVNPNADEWYEDTVRAVVERFAPALSERVAWSKMKGDPLY